MYVHRLFLYFHVYLFYVFFFKQKTAYEMRISDWSSDVCSSDLIFNFDVPTHSEDYVHRIGRTGRAGRTGTSITIAMPADGKYLAAIEKMLEGDRKRVV